VKFVNLQLGCKFYAKTGIWLSKMRINRVRRVTGNHAHL